MKEHPDSFGDALIALNKVLPADANLKLDALWETRGPSFATATWKDRVFTGKGETPSAALRDLAGILGRLAEPPRDFSDAD